MGIGGLLFGWSARSFRCFEPATLIALLGVCAGATGLNPYAVRLLEFLFGPAPPRDLRLAAARDHLRRGVLYLTVPSVSITTLMRSSRPALGRLLMAVLPVRTLCLSWLYIVAISGYGA